jgi:hypothetical protein
MDEQISLNSLPMNIKTSSPTWIDEQFPGLLKTLGMSKFVNSIILQYAYIYKK